MHFDIIFSVIWKLLLATKNDSLRRLVISYNHSIHIIKYQVNIQLHLYNEFECILKCDNLNKLNDRGKNL